MPYVVLGLLHATTVTLAIHDVFELYGRPMMYSWDPRDPVSMMFAYPTGPEKQVCPKKPAVVILNRNVNYQHLFLNREFAEALDLRENRTPAVHSRLLSIMVERMQRGPSSRMNQDSNGAPQLPPISGGFSD